MYVVTFYSFRGGVGRSLALANVAASLLHKGKRVLVVDFDLEAPGHPTIPFFGKGNDGPGLVEFVSEFRKSHRAPEVTNYTALCRHESKGGQLWLMPAGRQDDTYSARLADIDWQHLYAKEEGYLLFEDLKEQWRRTIKPDYVLVDSRTGHTDVGGICTRQLADAVVALFLPNDQNLVGLKQVVDAIKHEVEAPQEKKILIHFVLSNVPDLDDEKGILQRHVDAAKTMLGYSELAATIHHYDSLDLLDQVVFAEDRPKSRLARQYAELTNAIVRGNLRDREGALSYLQTVRTMVPFSRIAGSETSFSDLEERLGLISAVHGDDVEVLSEMADLRMETGDAESALRLLDSAIEKGLRTASGFRRRGELRRRLGRNKEALEDFLRVFSGECIEPLDVVVALRSVTELDDSALASVDLAEAVRTLDADERVPVFSRAMVNAALLPAIETGLRDVIKLSGSSLSRSVRTQLALNLLAQRKFEEAKTFLGERGSVVQGSRIDQIFNFAVAEWASTGKAPTDLFGRVVQLAKPRDDVQDANYAQCLAIACHWTGDQSNAIEWVKTARRLVAANPRQTFSAWRYLEVPFEVFDADLTTIERVIRGSDELPLFFPEQGPANKQRELAL
jgi:cellulose biosynthesis protein BcsQ